MAEAKKFNRVNNLENEVRDLEMLLQRLRHTTEDYISSILAKSVYKSMQDVESAPAKAIQSLRKAKGESSETLDRIDASSEKYNLIDVPDEMLTPDQLMQKKKQLLVKSLADAQLKTKQRQFEEEFERERIKKLEEEKRLENPERYRYLEELRAKHHDLSEKVDQRTKLKMNGGHTMGIITHLEGVGRGERLNPLQREGMRLLKTAAFDRGKGEDTFGAKDEDWQLYKLMSRDNDDDDDDADQPDDETELARLSSRLQEIDPTVFKPETGSASVEEPQFRPQTKENFQIFLGVERFRCPEILFNPNLIGMDQAGLDEMTGVSIRRLPSRNEGLAEKLSSSILLTGGSCLFPGLSDRLEAGIRMIRLCGTLPFFHNLLTRKYYIF